MAKSPDLIEWEDFEKIDLRVGRVVEVKRFEAARHPAYVLIVDLGSEIGRLKSSARITDLYTEEDLVGKLVVGVVNFPDKQVGSMMSECLITGFADAAGKVALCTPDKSVPLGARLF